MPNELPVLYAVIPGEPVPAPRPTFRVMPIASLAQIAKAATTGPGKMRMRKLMACFRPAPYESKTHKRYKAWKAVARPLFASARRAYCGDRPFVGDQHPVEVHILIVSPLPKTQERKRVENRPLRSWLTSHGKGDFDNLAKGVCDAANGVLWHDDRQVAAATVEKVRGAQGEPARTEVMVWPLNQREAGRTNFEQRRMAFRGAGRLFVAAEQAEGESCPTEWDQGALPL